jgi:hypothetical protein
MVDDTPLPREGPIDELPFRHGAKKLAPDSRLLARDVEGVTDRSVALDDCDSLRSLCGVRGGELVGDAARCSTAIFEDDAGASSSFRLGR